MKIDSNRLFTLLLTLMLFSGASAQDYQEQMKLIRPRPENCLVYGPVNHSENIAATDAQISLINPLSHLIIETIPADRNGWYLFSVKKGTVHGLLIETPGFFPYYSEFLIPIDHEEPAFNRPVFLPNNLRNRYTICFVPQDTLLEDDSNTLVNQLGDLLGTDPSLVLWFNPQGDDLDPVRINQLTGRLVNRGISVSRVRSGVNPPPVDTMIEVRIITDRHDMESLVNMKPEEPSEGSWTIQFAASKSSVSLKKFKGLEPVFEFKGKDGFYRYTFGNFPNKDAATAKLPFVKGKGYSQAFVKTVSSIKKL